MRAFTRLHRLLILFCSAMTYHRPENSSPESGESSRFSRLMLMHAPYKCGRPCVGDLAIAHPTLTLLTLIVTRARSTEARKPALRHKHLRELGGISSQLSSQTVYDSPDKAYDILPPAPNKKEIYSSSHRSQRYEAFRPADLGSRSRSAFPPKSNLH